METVSRADYLKKYMSSPAAEKQKKKKNAPKNSAKSKSGSMRLLDEDTYIQSQPGTSRNRKADSESEFEDDEELDEIERAVRALNKKSATPKNKKQDAAPSFKCDGFVTIEGPTDESLDTSNFQRGENDGQQSLLPVKKEIKEEMEDDESLNGKEVNVKLQKMGDGRRAGLLSKDTAREEQQKLFEQSRKEKEMADTRGQETETRKRVTGFNRDKRRRAKDEENAAEKQARETREAAKQVELEAKYSNWNRGVEQIKERERQLESMEQTLGETFTRHADDEALNEHLKEQLHTEDPMADYFRLKNHKIQMRTGVVYPTYKGQWAPNRYGIQPGYRWDGVDRSNGFESKLSLEKNKKMAHEELTYRSIAECE